MRPPRRYWLALVVVLCAFLPQPALAHLTPNSEVQLDFGPDHVAADIIIPQGEYAYATGNPAGNDAQSLTIARAFLRGHVEAESPDGARWTMQIESLEFAQIAGPPDLHAIVRLTPPEGQSARRVRINWTAVISEVPNHFVLFVARSDFGSGKLDNRREILGTLQAGNRSLEIDRGRSNAFAGFWAALSSGMIHIAIGHDHLLFLLALLLPAPLLAARGRWGRNRPVRAALWSIAKIVTAFTIGHSLTLIGAAIFGLSLPAQPVEVLIALSIAIAALHALRPIFPRREFVVAMLFGLVHGLAFATIIGHYGLGLREKALSILGFNIGIEIVQLLVVLAIMPALLLLSRTRFYPAFRVAAASFAGAAAIAWLAERISGVGNPVTGLLDVVLGYAPWFVAALTAMAVIAFVRRDTRRIIG